MDIKASEVKTLREKTGAGMMECKNALVNCQGDFAKAEKLLKEKGLAAVEKRADRATNEGKIFVRVDGQRAALVELATETDFVARNDEFISLGEAILDRVMAKGYDTINDELSAMVTELATKIRENMGLKRLKMIKAANNEIMTSYIHGDGRIGVVVGLASDKPEALGDQRVKDLVFDLALHVAAFNPMALERSQIDKSFLSEQEEIFRKQMESDEKLKGKPASVIDNILKGKINKYLSDICLVDQAFVKDEKRNVAQVLADTGKEIGAKLSVSAYTYFRVGE